MNFNSLNDKIIYFCKNQLENKGIEKGGMYEYYKIKTDIGEVISNYDVFISDFIINRFPNICKILEPASGIGTLSHLLYLLGYTNVTALEFDPRRYEANRLLGEFLETKVNLKHNQFPSPELLDYDLIVITNAENDSNKFSELVDFIKIYRGDFIFMPGLWEHGMNYATGCSLLIDNNISFIELEFEVVHIEDKYE